MKPKPGRLPTPLLFLAFASVLAPSLAHAEDSTFSPPAQSFEDPRIPGYTRMHPAWGVELMSSLKALNLGSDPGSFPNIDPSDRIRSMSLHLEYQPTFLQRIGVFSIGPSVAAYPITAAGSTHASKQFVNSPFSVWSLGGAIRYQARYFREQPIVPTVGFGGEVITWHLQDSHGRCTIKEFTFGAMVLMNWMEPSAAAEFYAANGVMRSYLVAELRNQQGSDGLLTVDGTALYFGLRFEY